MVYFYKMKKILLASILLSINFLTFCQNKKTSDSTGKATDKVDSTKLPAYLKTKDMPNLNILLDVVTKDGKQDTTRFTNADLPNDRPIILIYFSPECGHCQHEMKEIEKNIDSLKDAFFVFASRFPVDSIKKFEVKYNTGKYPNMVFGKEASYYLPVFFDIKFTPFMAIYDKKKQFVKSYDQGVEMHELDQLIAKLSVENVIDKKSKKKHTTK